MKETGVIFSAPMVRAIIAGTKTQTRRLVKPQPWQPGSPPHGWLWVGGSALERAGYGADYVHTGQEAMKRAMLKVCPFGTVGDRLWVRETWRYKGAALHFAADGLVMPKQPDDDVRAMFAHVAPLPASAYKWKSPLHLHRKHARLVLELRAVHVEPLHDISEEDAIAEGVGRYLHGWESYRQDTIPQGTARDSYACLWAMLHGKGAWHANPWVWVLTFKRWSMFNG